MINDDYKTVIVTGAGGGLGVNIVDNLLSSGYIVISQYRNKCEDLKNVYSSHDLDFNKNSFQCELTDENQVKALYDFSNLTTGNLSHSLWGIVNLAGSSTNSMSWKMSVDDFKQTIDNCLLSTFLVCREFIPVMRERNKGRIINISSVVAFTGVIGASHYCAAKSGIVGFTKSLSLELASKNITSNVIAPGYFDKGLINDVNKEAQELIKNKTPLKRFGISEELAATIKYLLSNDAGFITGQTLHVNGGLF